MQGQYEDSETGLYYNRYRYFDPNICAYVSQDPLGLLAGSNVYSYPGNIFKMCDPLGLCENTAKMDDFAKEPFLPDEYYKNNYAPMTSTPGERIDFYRLGSKGKIEKSRVIYDRYTGKQIYRVDFSDHMMPLDHTNPHLHEYIYGDQYNAEKGMEILHNLEGI